MALKQWSTGFRSEPYTLPPASTMQVEGGTVILWRDMQCMTTDSQLLEVINGRWAVEEHLVFCETKGDKSEFGVLLAEVEDERGRVCARVVVYPGRLKANEDCLGIFQYDVAQKCMKSEFDDHHVFFVQYIPNL